jgi:DNA (cytosine-5)-methyltransferase 1
VSAYYNEIDPYAAQWLRNLIAEGLIAPGDVDERDVRMVRPDDLRPYTQCHFFAGIAGWSLALRLAGWPDDRPVWTGSCPCQPFSAAGKCKASGDERHLWPHWFELIRACRPPVIFGEQVEAAIGWGWLDLVYSDLEEEGYAVGAAVLPSCSVGAPHIRQRLWFVADANDRRREQVGTVVGDSECEAKGEQPETGAETKVVDHCQQNGELADANEAGCSEQRSGGLLDGERATQRDDTDGRGSSLLADANGRHPWPEPGDRQTWSDLLWLPCTDGKSRPTQPGIFPLAHGVPARVAKLRAAGNAIVPALAAEFIKATID